MGRGLRHLALTAALAGMAGAGGAPVRGGDEGEAGPVATQRYLAHGGRKFDPDRRRARNKAARKARRKNRR